MYLFICVTFNFLTPTYTYLSMIVPIKVVTSENLDVQLLFPIDSPLYFCLIYFKIKFAPAIQFLKYMHENLSVNRRNLRKGLLIGKKSCTSTLLA